jgi:hypothetical protein
MGLTEQLNELKQKLGEEIPRETLVAIGQFIQELAQSGIEKTSCQAGDRIPSFVLPGVTGKMVSSKGIVSRGPAVLSFYRGVW